jgi:DNA invertase Pin-like site-specific DNA recombinase
MNDANRTIGFYIRTSTGVQDGEGQRHAIEARIRNEHGPGAVAAAREYLDIGLSGKDPKRPGIQRAVRDATCGEISALYCYSLNRLSRKLIELVRLVDTLTAAGVRLVFCSESIDAATPSGRLHLHFLAALAEYERECIRERTLVALAARKASGHRLGRPPRDVAADAVRAAVRMRDAGQSWSHIANVLALPATTIRRQVVAWYRAHDAGLPKPPPSGALEAASK